MTRTGIELEIRTGAAAPDDWHELIGRDPSSEYSQTAHWLESAAAQLPGRTARFITARREGRLVGGLAAVIHALSGPLRRGGQESSLFGTSGGPVIDGTLEPEAQDEVFDSLVAAYAAGRRPGLDSCAMVLAPDSERRFGGLLAGLRGWRRREVATAAVDLEGGFAVVERERIKKNKRNERNRGLRRGLEVVVTRDPDRLAAYHRLHVAASRIWGVEPTPIDFLAALLADPGDGTYFTCALLDGRVVGGHLCLHRGRRALAWQGVTDPEVARSHFPATALICADIEEACRRGAVWLDLGGSGRHGSLAGFKRYFGAEMQARGLYRHEPAALRWMRSARDLAERLGGRSGPGRWHVVGRAGGTE